LGGGREIALIKFLYELNKNMPELDVYGHEFSWAWTPGMKGFNNGNGSILLNRDFLTATDHNFNMDQLIDTAIHELLHNKWGHPLENSSQVGEANPPP
jgi:hypothetical protein